LIHIGQAVLAFGGTIDYFINTVFNYPTLAECYKVAAFDGINRIGTFHETEPPTRRHPCRSVLTVIPANAGIQGNRCAAAPGPPLSRG
jgi:hypothetical protein